MCGHLAGPLVILVGLTLGVDDIQHSSVLRDGQRVVAVVVAGGHEVEVEHVDSRYRRCEDSVGGIVGIADVGHSLVKHHSLVMSE